MVIVMMVLVILQCMSGERAVLIVHSDASDALILMAVFNAKARNNFQMFPYTSVILELTVIVASM